MRNLILEKDMCEKSDADGSDSTSTRSFHTGNSHKIVDLRQLLRDKIRENEIFCSFEIVSTRKSDAFYRRSV